MKTITKALLLITGALGAKTATAAEPLPRCNQHACIVVHSTTDADSDGVSDDDELAAGTDPKDPNNVPPVEQLLEMAQLDVLPSFSDHHSVIVVLPTVTSDGKPVLGGLPALPGRKDALARLGITSDMLGTVDLSNGLTISRDNGPAVEGKSPFHIGGIDLALISAGDDDATNPPPRGGSHPNPDEQSSNGNIHSNWASKPEGYSKTSPERMEMDLERSLEKKGENEQHTPPPSDSSPPEKEPNGDGDGAPDGDQDGDPGKDPNQGSDGCYGSCGGNDEDGYVNPDETTFTLVDPGVISKAIAGLHGNITYGKQVVEINGPPTKANPERWIMYVDQDPTGNTSVGVNTGVPKVILQPRTDPNLPSPIRNGVPTDPTGCDRPGTC